MTPRLDPRASVAAAKAFMEMATEAMAEVSSVTPQESQDRSRSIITICDLEPMSAISAKTLKDMGFTNVSFIECGMQGWRDARSPIRHQTIGRWRDPRISGRWRG